MTLIYTQLYATIDVCDELNRAETLITLTCCITEIRSWMGNNLRNLMIKKQLYSFLASPHDLPYVIDTAIQVGDVYITSSQSVRNLGIVLDQTLSMKQHITHVCKSAFIHLRNIRNT